MGATATEIAGRRSTDPGTLRRQVTGDLNWIVMKAMEKDRQRRYPAVSELAADIRRHLDDQPVLASPPSPMYRTRKFVRRHKLPVLAAAAVLLALVGGIVATSWQAAIARRERAEALHQKADAVAASALAEQRSRETLAERNRAEEQTALAVRQEEVAERQRTVAEARLSDVHALADSMLFEINDDVKDLPGGTKAREALVRLGQQYLNKETAATQNDPQRRQELAEAFVKVGDLQGAPGQSNLRDIAGARESYARSAAMLEADVKARPHDPKIRHLLTLAYVRQAALEETRSAKDAGFERAQESAEDYAAQWPTDPQGPRDLAEVKLARGKHADAVKLREQILAGNPKDPVLRWELAQAQLAYGSYLVGKDNQQALGLLQKVADLCEALSKEESANVQYQRDRAVALSYMSGGLKSLDRVDEAVTRAGQSVSILEQLTASDRRNASFRLDLSAARLALAEAHYEKGHIAEASENMAAAASIQEEQAARYPDNPDFPRQAAIYHRTLGNYKTTMKEYKAAMEAYRHAEALDRKLVARYPRRLEFAEALSIILSHIGDTFEYLDDKPSALNAYSDGLRIAKGAQPAEPTEESLWALGIAHHGVANGFANMSRWEEAIPVEREFVAILERRATLDPSRRELKRSLCSAYRELSLYYDARGDTKSAIAASEKALPFLEADYAAHLDDITTESALWGALFSLRNQYTRAGDYDRGIAAARRCVEIAELTGSSSRDEYSRNRHLAASLINLQGTLRRSGRRDEALAIAHRAVSVLDRHPIEQEKSPARRSETAVDYLYLVEDLNFLRRQEEGAIVCRRVLPVLEALYRDSPDNNRHRDSLVRGYHLASPIFLNLGDLAGALDVENKALKLEPPAKSPAEVENRALRVAHAGSLELRLGHREVAIQTWREALTLFQRAAAESEKLWTSNPKNLSALETLRLSEGWAGFILEELGDFPQSVNSRKSSYTRALALLKSDRGTPANGVHYRVSQAHIVRDLSLLDGDHADYHPYFENGNPTGEEIRAVLAFAWRYRASVMYTAGSPIPSRLQSAQKAVGLSRQLVAHNPSVTNRVLLSESLMEEGDVFIAQARYSEGTEMTSAYQASRDRYAESLGVLNSLKEAGNLPSEQKANLVTVANHLAEAEERVHDATLSTKAKQP
jgi:tetratricopeptide (TPR) repeat protein